VSDVERRRFHVTHPYHPLFGQEFELIICTRNWREARVWYLDGDEHLHSLPTAWTSVMPDDPFNIVAAGRALFRVDELLELCRLIGEVKS
jgi:hypothetical protein